MSLYKKFAAIATATIFTSCLLSGSVFASIKAHINSADINVRDTNSTSGEVIAQLPIDQYIQITEKSGDFIRIKLGDFNNAYVFEDFVTITEADGVINDDWANIRVDADDESEVLATAELGQQVTMVGLAGDYVIIDFDGQDGYIHRDFLDSEYIDQLATPEELTQKVADAAQESVSLYAMVTSDSGLNMRSEPTSDADVIEQLSNSDVLDIVENVDGWVKVKTSDGSEGYVNAEFVSVRLGVKPTKPVVSSIGEELVDFSKQYIGTPYVWGGTALGRGVDCSGFVYSVYKNFGYTLNRTSRSMPGNGDKVAKSDLIPGDLVFFSNGGAGNIQHVGIYIGEDQFIHSSSGRTRGVIISGMNESYYVNNYVTACRVIR